MFSDDRAAGNWAASLTGDDDSRAAASGEGNQGGAAVEEDGTRSRRASRGSESVRVGAQDNWVVKRAHAFTYVGLFLFTATLYFRPYELIPSLIWLKNMLAQALAALTLAVFIPSQLGAEGNLTARPREINLILFFCVTGLLSIPFALNRVEAWDAFVDFLKVALMFVVIVNAVRSEGRLKGLFFLAMAVGCMLSVRAIIDSRSVDFVGKGQRLRGLVGGMFANPNDLATFLVTVVPIPVALLLSKRGLLRKFLYGACVLLMVAGSVVTLSRGAFLGLMGAAGVLGWKIGRKHRFAVVVAVVLGGVAFVVLAPGDFTGRLTSILDADADVTGSSHQRMALLLRSIRTAIFNPVFGIGMGNFHIVSIHEFVSHNSYTQVAAEMGLTALVLYVLFMLTPLNRLRQIERESFEGREGSRFYYLSVGLQASIVAYMIASFFGSVAYQWYIYYLVGYAVCLRRLYATQYERASAFTSGADKRRHDDDEARDNAGDDGAAAARLDAGGVAITHEPGAA